jgi:hypothetical protein
MTSTTRPPPTRVKLPDERKAVTWKLTIGVAPKRVNPTVECKCTCGGCSCQAEDPYDPSYVKAFVTLGEFDDGDLGEIFVTPDKEGSFARGIMDGFATLLSIALQYGVPLEVVAKKFVNGRFAPAGMTNDKSTPIATSFLDLLFRKLSLRYLDEDTCAELGIVDRALLAKDQQEGDDNGKSEDIERPEDLDEGWVAQHETNLRGEKVAQWVNLQAKCFTGDPSPHNFPKDREDRSEPAEDRQGAGEAPKAT